MIPDGSIVAYGPGLTITQEHIRQMRGNKCNGYILMDPRDFLDLTTSSSAEERMIKMEAKSLDEYNEFSRVGQNILPPWLDIETQKPPIGKVIGHEGRHRAAALIKEGIYKMPVFLVKRENHSSIWRKNVSDKYGEYRYVDQTDFPQYALGEYLPYRVELDLKTWKDIR